MKGDILKMKLFESTRITRYKQLVILIMYGITHFENFNAQFRIEVNRKEGIGVSVLEAAKIRFNDLMKYADHWCKWNGYDLGVEIELMKKHPKVFLEKYKIEEDDYSDPMRSYLMLRKVAETINQNYTLDIAMVKENLNDREIKYITNLIDPRWISKENKWQRKNFVTASVGQGSFVT